MKRKRSKLREKPARIPVVTSTFQEAIILEYLKEVDTLTTESARSHCFTTLFRDLKKDEPQLISKYFSGIEKQIRAPQEAVVLRGEVDNLFGSVIIEFERKIPQKRAEAEEQLRRYAAILMSAPDTRRQYLCVATDGVRFVTYTPILAHGERKEASPDNVKLCVLEEIDWTRRKPAEVFYWIDRNFFREDKNVPPTSEAILFDFGAKSHACSSCLSELSSAWSVVKDRSEYSVILESWLTYLRVVYGREDLGDELFIRHTYLAVLAKLMVWVRITGKPQPVTDDDILKILSGGYFTQIGIENFLEEDFFSWVGRDGVKDTALTVTRWLLSLLQVYNLRGLSEDVLKSIYQELVDPQTRHDLGEFYTPDWLAHRIVNVVLDSNPKGSVLDPACGSGTFLYLTIREKCRRLSDTTATLNHILESVCGIDIHPLAVIVAKTNYILALGDLLESRKKRIHIPVYMADLVSPPKPSFSASGSDYEVIIGNRRVVVPVNMMGDSERYDAIMDSISKYAAEYRGRDVSGESFAAYLSTRGHDLGTYETADDYTRIKPLFEIARTLQLFITENRDSIWAFVLKNIYKPLFFKRRFDFVVGNPPWISFRYLEPEYQKSIKEFVVKDYGLLQGRGELITHLEVGTLFLLRCADFYLKPGGQIAFVLPRSIFTADQHDGLRKRTFRFKEDSAYKINWVQVWDCEDVEPLFKVPCCVVIAEKTSDTKPTYPTHGLKLSGKMPQKNATLAQAQQALVDVEVQYDLQTTGTRSYLTTEDHKAATDVSFYKGKFAEGATIVPRSFWFVRVRSDDSGLGFDTSRPPVETSPGAHESAKPLYKDAHLSGQVESRFLYTTLLSTDMLPFGCLDLKLVVLPIEPEGDQYRLVDAEEARERGYFGLAEWLTKVDEAWVARRGIKADKLSALERLDYRKDLTTQLNTTGNMVLYNTSGTNLCAVALTGNQMTKRMKPGCVLDTQGFVADCKTYFMRTTSDRETLFVASVLNSPIIDELLKPLQSRGLWGPRDICAKVLELPIPQFNPTDPSHSRLAEIGELCSSHVSRWILHGGPGKIKSVGKLRSMVRSLLKEQLAEIDELVKYILK